MVIHLPFYTGSFVSLCFLCFRFHGNLGYKEALLVAECCYVSDAVVLTDLKDGTNAIDQTLLLHVDQWNYKKLFVKLFICRL